ncbi:hypothetical protein UPYG_G00214690 [Umbra pygmaea]|uniref:Ig-like domain-containing protein n=1 Tax=Umbra pygmaea TaxID=75934 RepID=A0ABD0WLG3_UMBPY
MEAVFGLVLVMLSGLSHEMPGAEPPLSHTAEDEPLSIDPATWPSHLTDRIQTELVCRGTRLGADGVTLVEEEDGETDSSADVDLGSGWSSSMQASGFPPQLYSECLSQGEVRVSCFSERDSPQYSWTLDGNTLDTTMAFLSNITDTVILKKGLVGSLACRVNNDINTPTVTWDITPCTVGSRGAEGSPVDHV